MTLQTTSKEVKATIAEKKLRLYTYDDSPLYSINDYLYRQLENGINFLVYREEAHAALAVFSYNDRIFGFEEAFSHITQFLTDTFLINHFSHLCEITACMFYDALLEAKRRSLMSNWTRIIEAIKLDYYENYGGTLDTRKYILQEKIVSEDTVKSDLLLDESVKSELENIESHQNTSSLSCNMVHYFISSKSIQAAADITEAVMQKLIKANRLKSRRIELVSEISPMLSSPENYFEEVVESNFGGVIIIDTSVKFGSDSTKYNLACRYIEKTFNRYKNECLFVFVYNTDVPGFAYELLKSVSNDIIPVRLKEGSGDRKTAARYLKALIKASEYSAQASEFMKLFPGDTLWKKNERSAWVRTTKTRPCT